MTKKVYILYIRYLTKDGTGKTIGGIQTYIDNLCEVVRSINKIPVIIQLADINFHKTYNDTDVYGVKSSKIRLDNRKLLLEKCLSLYNKGDIVIFASDATAIDNDLANVISIQHGVFWDIPKHQEYSSFRNRLYFFKKTFDAYKTINRVNRSNLLVCVDYNFQNWYRTQLAYPEVETIVVPNFTEIPVEIEKPRDKNSISIIFARRFFKYRGTTIFSQAISKILNEYNDIKVIFAGEGPEENNLKKQFSNDNRVTFIKYNSTESLEIHKIADIAVVPTIGSEGTSLSLLEAMASSCAVIATDVGGLTNIILDDYNGLLINPTSESLYYALKKLIENEDLRKELAENGYETVKNSFNKEKWAKDWAKILNSFD